MPADWPAADGEALHELRKRVVIHRYQMDIIEPLWPRFAKMWTGEAQRLRDRLGKHQDLLMLESLTGPHQPLARWRSRLAPAIAERKAAHVAPPRASPRGCSSRSRTRCAGGSRQCGRWVVEAGAADPASLTGRRRTAERVGQTRKYSPDSCSPSITRLCVPGITITALGSAAGAAAAASAWASNWLAAAT